MGIEVYATSTAGIGGVIRESVEDFVVEEVLVDGSKATIKPLESHTELRVLGSSPTQNTHLLCVLVKRNWDTFMAMRTVAKHLGIPSSRIHFAGIKDAKAVTAQHVTIEEATAEEAQKVSMRDIELRPVGYLRHPISSYYLLGNSFRITISQIGHDEAAIRQQIAETTNQLAQIGGAPNFYGHQRFGTTRPITHQVGKALVQGNIQQAVMLFLAEPFREEHPESQQARKQLRETQDFKKALGEFPNQLRYERFMLRRLVEKPDDFVGAFRTLPPRLRVLFVQACQSYLFNKSLSMRITNGLPLSRVVAGDFAVGVERSGLPAVAMFKTATAENLADINKAIEKGKTRPALPLIGFRQRLSQGVQGEIEKQIIEQENIKPDDFKIQALPEASSKGELRTTTTPINGLTLETVSTHPSDASKRKVTLSFMLQRGSYATVVLREIMKPPDPVCARF
jgi:tRNA pseudouridine13 synthase